MGADLEYSVFLESENFSIIHFSYTNGDNILYKKKKYNKITLLGFTINSN